MSKTFKIYTLGCKVNQYDSRYLRTLLTDQGHDHVKSGADLVIVNTCAVTQKAISKDKRKINKARKENPGAKVVLMGCWPQAYKSQVQQLDVDMIWGVGKLNDLLSYIQGFLGATPTGSFHRVSSIISEERSRYFLKVQDGCDHFCSYCIIPYTRGRVSSQREEKLLEEVGGVVHAGFEEIVVSGIHLGMYGKDTGTNLTELLKKMIKVPGVKRIRLSSLEINEVNDELLGLIANSGEICKHLHIPLQSGSDRVLQSMNRPYTGKEFQEKLEQIKARIPDIAISGDVIVGFPGETEEDFSKSYELVADAGFSRLHVFPYSAHPGTPAAKMSEQVSAETAKQRSLKLQELGEKLEKRFKDSFRGSELDVVVGNVTPEKIRGTTQYYFDVDLSTSDIVSYCDHKNVEDPQRLIGKIIKVKL